MQPKQFSFLIDDKHSSHLEQHCDFCTQDDRAIYDFDGIRELRHDYFSSSLLNRLSLDEEKFT